MLQFEFNGHTSDEYGLIVTRIEENDTLVNRSLQLGEKNKYRPKENQFGTLYSDNYSFKMGVMRNPCRNKNVVPELKNGILRYDPTYTPYLDNGILKFSMNYTADIKNGIIIPNDSDYLTSNNIRIINAWLTSPQYPRLLKFIGDDYFSEEIEFFATITEVSTEHASLPYELTYTVTCDSQWGYTPLILCKTTSSSTLTREYSIRYMESSLNGEQEPYSIGDVDNGIGCTECYKCRINCMAKIDRRTQSTDECFYCPIAAGCSNCSGYDYQVNGTPDSKATYICVMHKARALGNLYFWNKYYRKNNMNKRMKNYVPDEWALEIISESELNMLKELERED